jgi:hypothetical protein
MGQIGGKINALASALIKAPPQRGNGQKSKGNARNGKRNGKAGWAWGQNTRTWPEVAAGFDERTLRPDEWSVGPAPLSSKA